jgi:hypothetical protein
MDLVAFHGKQETKEFYLKRLNDHRLNDELIKGTYWENGRGCGIGCTVHSGDHAAYEKQLGIPRVLARLEDGLFEALPNGEAMLWPERFLSAIQPGADLSLIWPRFAVWMLVDAKWGVLQFALTEQSKTSIQSVADGYKSVIEGATPNWQEIAAAAAAAAADAAAAAAARWAAAAARWAAAAAADAAAAAADAAARWAAAADNAAAAADNAAAAADARWRSAQADKLIELLEAAVPARVSALPDGFKDA